MIYVLDVCFSLTCDLLTWCLLLANLWPTDLLSASRWLVTYLRDVSRGLAVCCSINFCLHVLESFTLLFFSFLFSFCFIFCTANFELNLVQLDDFVVLNTSWWTQPGGVELFNAGESKQLWKYPEQERGTVRVTKIKINWFVLLQQHSCHKCFAWDRVGNSGYLHVCILLILKCTNKCKYSMRHNKKKQHVTDRDGQQKQRRRTILSKQDTKRKHDTITSQLTDHVRSSVCPGRHSWGRKTGSRLCSLRWSLSCLFQ